ncbi:hypothetical protein ASC97_23270 [Rhizobium sp. Root1203]|nr:hypothetical protein ASC97_23270 [Rhizobium sp. Root1203]
MPKKARNMRGANGYLVPRHLLCWATTAQILRLRLIVRRFKQQFENLALQYRSNLSQRVDSQVHLLSLKLRN